MTTENRWFRATFEATGHPCEVVAVYNADADDAPLHLALADGRKLTRISHEVAVTADPNAP